MTTTDDKNIQNSNSRNAAAPMSTGMHVRKRNGELEIADVTKIVRAVERCVGYLENVDPLRIATRTISGLMMVLRQGNLTSYQFRLPRLLSLKSLRIQDWQVLCWQLLLIRKSKTKTSILSLNLCVPAIN